MTLHESVAGAEKIKVGNCMFCDSLLQDSFINVSWSLDQEQLNHSKWKGISTAGLMPTYVCPQCFLIQVPDETQSVPNGPFYASSFSNSWLGDLKEFTDLVFSKMETSDHGLAVELARHNDKVSSHLTFQKGLSSFIDSYGKANLLIAHHELGHIPDVNGFLSTVKLFLSPRGVATFEFLHVVRLMEDANPEPPCDRYFPWLSLTTWDRMLAKYGMVIFEVEPCQPAGSLRIYVKHAVNPFNKISNQVRLLRGSERNSGICLLSTYSSYKSKSEAKGRSYAAARIEEPAITTNQELLLQA